MKELNQFIKSTKDVRELKRSLAVEQSLNKRPWDSICKELGVSHSFISKWRSCYKKEGVASLKVAYKGSQSYLSSEQKASILQWLEGQDHWDLGTVVSHIQENYGVRYRSRQSYYELMKEAGLSWKKTQKRNPARNPQEVEKKREAIKKK